MLKGAPKRLAMTLVVGKGSLGQSPGDGAEEMEDPWPLIVYIDRCLCVYSSCLVCAVVSLSSDDFHIFGLLFGSIVFQQNTSTSTPRKVFRMVAEHWASVGDINDGGSCRIVPDVVGAYPAITNAYP